MLKEGNYGYVERAAFWSFALGMLGMALTVIAMYLLEDQTDALWVLAAWWSPIPICIVCWWSVAAKEDLGEVSTGIAIFCVLGAFTGRVESMLGIPILIALSFVLGFFHKLARSILNIGRLQNRRL